MPKISFRDLAERFIATLERFSATVIVVSSDLNRKPLTVRVVTAEGPTDCHVFLWTITPGGGPPGTRPKDERRIQITAAKRFPLVPGFRTLVGGWSQEYGVYAFWDVRRHSRYSKKSPSFQVNARTLETGGTVGIATQFRRTKQGREVVAAIAEGSLLWYIQHGEPLHDVEEDAAHVAELVDATAEEITGFVESSESELQVNRRVDVVNTIRAYRDAKFRPAVLQAYSYRCAVCGYALKLVDAAHIVPVIYPQSTDLITNGLALCRLHHGAYDNGLLGIHPDYRIITNPAHGARYREIGLDAGLQDFERRLPLRITVPSSIEARPDPGNLLLGLKARNWPDSLLS